MAQWVGPFLCILFYYTIIAGFYTLYCPVLYLMFVNLKLYRKISDKLFTLWEYFPVILFEKCCYTKIHYYGDKVNSNENIILIMNHRTRVDWIYVWIALYHADRLPSTSKVNGPWNLLKQLMGGNAETKFVLKDDVKFIPALGWIMQLNYFLYVKRDWREDQTSLAEFVDYYSTSGSGYKIVLFPEGTDLSEENKRKSDSFAAKSNLPNYELVLHPRTTGWSELCCQLRNAGLSSVYDVTIAYDEPPQTETDLLRGNIPRNVYFCVKRYTIDELPIQKDDLKAWLSERWLQKEMNLRFFHNNDKTFDITTDGKIPQQKLRSLSVAWIAFVLWLVVDIFFILALIRSTLFQFWVMYHTVLFVFATWWFGGFHKIQYKLFCSFR